MEQRGKARAVDGPRGEVDVGSVGKGTTSPGERVLHHTVGGPPGSRREAHAPTLPAPYGPFAERGLSGATSSEKPVPAWGFRSTRPLTLPSGGGRFLLQP